MKKKGFEFPTAYTVLFIILIAVTILTHVIPAGTYSRLSYNGEAKEFIVDNQIGEVTSVPATQEELDKLGIKIELSKFENGIIRKPVAIPDTYKRIEQQPKGFIDLIKSPIEGLADSMDIVIFLLILGGIIGLINSTGTFNVAMRAVSEKTKGKEFFLVAIAFTFVALCGTTFGFCEETIPFYMILVPLFLSNGFDLITSTAAIFVASHMGCMFSTVNPFSIIIASNAAGISFNEGMIFRYVAFVLGVIICLTYIYFYTKKVKKNPEKSLAYDFREQTHERFLKDYDSNSQANFTIRQKIILLVFICQFAIMIWGVSFAGWWFQEIASVFFGFAIFMMFISGLGEKAAVGNFVAGSSEIIGVTLTIGIARAINLIMDSGMISDTLLYYSTHLISSMTSGIFSFALLIVYLFLGIFIPSSSGLAVLTMPILAPLADTMGLSRALVVDAYSWGQGLILFLTPTGIVFIVLEIVGIPYNKWVKFLLPLMGVLAVFSAIMLFIQTMI